MKRRKYKHLVSRETKKICKDNGIIIRQERYRQDYSRMRMKIVTERYNLLQYLGIVSEFIRKRYDINQDTLEGLCFLYPMVAFTSRDVAKSALSRNVQTIRNWVKAGYLEKMVAKGPHTVYCLSTRAKTIVEYYHRYLVDIDSMPASALSINERGDKGTKLRDLIRKLRD